MGERKVLCSFSVEVGVKQGCVMTPWLFNIYMDGCIREMKVGVWDLGARLNVRDELEMNLIEFVE